MASPTWTLLTLLQAQLATIRVVNGFRTDIGLTARLELHQFDASAGPSLAIAMQSETIRDLTTTVRQRTIQLIAECLVPLVSDQEQELAHDALEDLLQVFPATQQYAVAAGITAAVTLLEGRVVAAPEGMSVIAAQVDLTALMREQR